MPLCFSMNEDKLCHTPDECASMYAAIPVETKAPALLLLAKALNPIAVEPEPPAEDWYKSRLVAMTLRNLLRSNGFDEEYFHVHNLDDIYPHLVADALQLQY